MDGWANKPKIVVVCGPTATGKTELAFQLCQAFQGQLVGADSMQIYQGLPVGTAAPLPQMYPKVPRHLVACLPPEETFSVADYLTEAGRVVAKIAQQGQLPVVCGGTGQYTDGLVNGICFAQDKVEDASVMQLEEDWEQQGGEGMLARLAALDPACAAKLHPKDKKRVLRALSLSQANGSTLAQRNAASRQTESPYDALVLGLCYDDRQELYKRIEARIEAMLVEGLLEEARLVYAHRQRYRTAVQAIGYKEFFPYLEGMTTLEECVAMLKQATRRYAKRQLTWLRAHPPNLWLYRDKMDVWQEANRAVEDFLQGRAI